MVENETTKTRKGENMTKNEGIRLLGQLATRLLMTKEKHEAEVVAARNREFLRLSQALLNYSANTREFRESVIQVRAFNSAVGKEIEGVIRAE